MKRLVKFLPKFMMFCFVCLITLALIGCNNGGGNANNDEFWDADGNGIEDWMEKEITLRYATWQYNNPEAVTIDTLLIDEFMKKYPNIHVEMQIVGEDVTFETNLLTLMEAEDLPDVFLVNRLENLLPYNMLADITAYFNHDTDTQYIFDSVRDLGIYEGKRYCVPTFIYPEIWIVNKTLLRQNNTPIPSYDWTWDQMEAIAQAVGNNATLKTIGLYGTEQYYFELPKIMKLALDQNAGKSWLAYGYNGNKFNFLDTAYLNAMQKLEDGLSAQSEGYGWLIDNLDEETLNVWYGSTEDPRYAGHVAIWREPSWSFKDHMDDLIFDWDIYPGPSGVSGGNTDIAGVSSLCENKAAAYQLLKWMSFGKDGMVARYSLYEEYSEELYISANNYPYPVVDYGINKDGVNEIWDNIPYKKTADGFGAPQFVESLRNGAIKCNKEVVGWDAAENAFKGYLAQVVMEGAHYATLAETAQQAADDALKLQRDAVAEAIRNMQ